MNKALFKENIKRFWPISAAAFVLYFLFGPFSLMSEDYVFYNRVRYMLSNENTGLLLLECLLPVVMAAAVFQYLFKVNSTGVFHAMPFSRKQLLATGTASAAVLCLAPQVLTAAVFLVLRYGNLIHVNASEYSPIMRYWSFTGIGYWLVVAALVSLFCLAICVFGAAISGTTVICILTGMGLNALLPILHLLRIYYYEQFMFGFSEDSGLINLEYYHPALFFLSKNYLPDEGPAAWGSFLLAIAGYLAVCALVLLAAWLVYEARHNERTGDSYVFSAAGIIIGLLLVLLGSLFFGALLGESVSAYCLGAAISFILAQMIIRKTPRIFDRELLKPFGLAFVMMALIFGYFVFDPLGFETKVPEASSVEYATIRGWDIENNHEYLLQDQERIENLCAFHRAIVNDPDARNDFHDLLSVPQTQEIAEDGGEKCADATTWDSVRIFYKLKSGKTLYRRYSVPIAYLLQSEEMKQLVMSEEDQGIAVLQLLKKEDLSLANVFISANGDFREDFSLQYDIPVEYVDTMGGDAVSTEQKERLVEALMNTYQDRTYEERIMPNYLRSYNIEFICTNPPEHQVPDDFYSNMYTSYYEVHNGEKVKAIERFNFWVAPQNTEVMDIIAEIAKANRTDE